MRKIVKKFPTTLTFYIPTKKELKLVWEIVALLGSLVGVGLGIRDLMIQYDLGILFEPRYYFAVDGRVGMVASYFYNFLPIFAIFLLISVAVSGVFEINKIMQTGKTKKKFQELKKESK